MERMRELIEKLNEAAKAYYQEDREIISNYEYDKLYEELERLEKESGTVFSNSPTKKVGYEVLGSLTKVPHESRMLSLDKTKEVLKLKSFLLDGEGILSWKMDGLTIVLNYSDGELRQAVTRGNGEVGEDITHNARVFKNVPVKIPFDGELTLRGEAVIHYRDFEAINEELAQEEKYKNPRNLCSGTVRQLNSEIAAARNVVFYAFSLVKASGKNFEHKSEQLNFLSELGFFVVPFVYVNTENVEDAVKAFEAGIEKNDFGSDGLVLTYDSIALSESLGVTSKFPKDSIAFKWADDIRETKLLKVEWNTSRTGLINPVAVFEPVELEGTTVKQAALHNVSYIEGLELGIGDIITVYKANMIIPQLAENFTRSGTLTIPDKCPVCGGEAQVLQQKEGKALYCTNSDCRAQLNRSLTHFVSRDAMNIEGFSESTIEKFVEKGFLNDYTDIYNLAEHEDEIKNMEGFGEKSAAKLLSAIEKSREPMIFSFIYALGISQVGLSNAKLLCAHFDYDISRIMQAEFDELESITGFGEVIANSLRLYFANEKNRKLIAKVLTILKLQKPEADTDAREKPLDGKIFVLTGDTEKFVNRKELQAFIETKGGKVTGSVTGKTSFLINNDTLSSSSKNKKAKELGVIILSENDLLNMVNGGV